MNFSFRGSLIINSTVIKDSSEDTSVEFAQSINDLVQQDREIEIFGIPSYAVNLLDVGGTVSM